LASAGGSVSDGNSFLFSLSIGLVKKNRFLFVNGHLVRSFVGAVLFGELLTFLIQGINPILGQNLLQLGVLFENDAKSDFGFARDQFVSYISQQCVEHFWESVEENCFKWETSSLLLKNAGINLGVLVFRDIENSFDPKMMEHTGVSLLEPSDSFLQISHDLNFHFEE